TLYQDVAAQVPTAFKHDYFPTEDNTARDFLAHAVEITPGSRLGQLMQHGVTKVNSMHHQAIKKVAPGLKATALSPDGIIEGVEGANGQYLVAVQWHPEELADRDENQRRLFASFIEASR